MKLNPEQQQAVDHFEGVCVVTAIPGSGKTRALTARVMSLVQDKNVDPSNILCLTFTNKAANEMRERISHQLGQVAENIWVSTFHALCIAILRKYGDRVGLDKGFSIYTEKDQKELMDKVVRMQGYEPTYRAKTIKQYCKSANDFREDVVDFEEHVNHLPYPGPAVIKEYLELLDKWNAVDFTGILYKTWLLFKRHPRATAILKDKFQFVLVDEMQDTNTIQYELVHSIVDPEKQRSGNLFVVGDYNQCVREGEYVCTGPNDEIKLIEDLNVGDHVLTCAGGGELTTKPIVAKQSFTKQVMETSIKIHDKEFGECLKVTHNHQMFVQRRNEHNLKTLSNGMSVTLVGDHRSQSHRFSIQCVNEDLVNAIENELGLEFHSDVRYSCCDGTRKLMSDILKIKNLVLDIADRLGVRFWFREKAKILPGEALDVVDASSIVSGDCVPAVKSIEGELSIQLTEVLDIITRPATATYYDFEIQDTHNFISEGIIHSNSIFSWRGAKPENIQRVNHDFDEVKEIVLLRNYRSTDHILQSAQNLIRHNDNARDVHLVSDRGSGHPVVFKRHSDVESEANYIAAAIQAMKAKNNYSLNDFAILYRTNVLSKQPEIALRKYDIPYKIIGGFSFFDRREIKDALAYLSFVVNPNDSIQFARAISSPRRSLGSTAIGRIERHCHDHGVSILESCQSPDVKLTSKMRQNLDEFVTVIQTAQQAQSNNVGLTSVISNLLKESGYYDYIEQEDKKEKKASKRVDNLDEFLVSVADYEERKPTATIGDFLHTVQLLTSDLIDKDDDEAVTLLTMHSAKGLEFPVVFIIGAEKGLIPHQMALAERGDKEERRLMYVAISRARDYLSINHCTTRRKYNFGTKSNRIEYCEPSPFLREILKCDVIPTGAVPT